jgi:putative YphP/YqiW family bacilliredoxin
MDMSRYDREAVKPLWQELTSVGVEPLTSAADVDRVLSAAQGTTLLVVNSVCGCAAGSCRPGVALSLQNETIPDHLHTVFAGVDLEATARAREYMKGIPPSSPAVALFKEGRLEFVLQRSDIEGRYAQQIAETLRKAYDQTCSRRGPSVAPEVFQRTFGRPEPECGSTFRIKQ